MPLFRIHMDVNARNEDEAFKKLQEEIDAAREEQTELEEIFECINTEEDPIDGDVNLPEDDLDPE